MIYLIVVWLCLGALAVALLLVSDKKTDVTRGDSAVCILFGPVAFVLAALYVCATNEWFDKEIL